MRVKPLLLIPIVAVALAACSTQATPKPETTQAATEKPLFATDEEALAAAQAAYANYLEVSDQIARDGGANPERLKDFVTADMYQSEKATLDSLSQKQMIMTGQSRFDTAHIQAITGSSVSMYLCLDTSEARLSSPDLVPDSSVNRWPLVVTMSKSNSGELVLEDSQTWSGTNFC